MLLRQLLAPPLMVEPTGTPPDACEEQASVGKERTAAERAAALPLARGLVSTVQALCLDTKSMLACIITWHAARRLARTTTPPRPLRPQARHAPAVRLPCLGQDKCLNKAGMALGLG